MITINNFYLNKRTIVDFVTIQSNLLIKSYNFIN